MDKLPDRLISAESITSEIATVSVMGFEEPISSLAGKTLKGLQKLDNNVASLIGDKTAKPLSALEVACALAKKGKRVFATYGIEANGSSLRCNCWKAAHCSQPGKHPIPREGLYAATTELKRIKWWFEKQPKANLALVTGQENGFFVLDVDGEEGIESLNELERQYGVLPPTLEVLTGGGGIHYYFKYPANVKIANSASKIAPNLDIRGDGGYVIIPPSRHISGRHYVWSVDTLDEKRKLAEAPKWLLDLATTPEKTETHQKRNWAELAQEIPEGKRNDTICRFAGHLFRKNVDVNIIIPAMIGLNKELCYPPLEYEEVMAIINSVAGMSLKKDMGV